MPNLIQTVMSALPSGGTSDIAGLVGESPAATSSGMKLAVPALLAGALQKSSTSSGANDLLGLSKQATAGGNPLDRFGSILHDGNARNNYLEQGHNLANSLLGKNSDAITTRIADSRHISGGAMSTLLALLAPLVLGALGRTAGATPSAAGLQSTLASERGSILGALPSGIGDLYGRAPSARTGARRDVRTETTDRGSNLPWILGAIALALLGIWALRNFSRPQLEAPGVNLSLPNASLPSLPHVNLSLPNGRTIDVAQGSIGYGVARFLGSSDPTPKTFTFDNLNFDAASNTPTAASAPTIASLAAVLKAYPSAQVRIIGHTDGMGDPQTNVRISQTHATAVKDALVRDGVGAGRVTTAGVGSASPIADNGTAEGRARNRRTELEIVSR